MVMVTCLDLVRVCALFALLVSAAYTDLVRGRVYNWSTYPGILLGLMICLAVGGQQGVPSLADSLVGLAVGFGVFYLAYLMKGVGLGDVKLMAAVGALMGWRFALRATVYSAFFGAVLGIGLLLYRGRLWEGVKKSLMVFLSPSYLRKEAHVDGEPVLTGLTIPYGFATAVGSLLAFATHFL
jgi:prepilin peptidase CpaA